MQSASYTNGVLSIVNESGETISLDLSNVNTNNPSRSTPTDIPIIYFGKVLPTSKDQEILRVMFIFVQKIIILTVMVP